MLHQEHSADRWPWWTLSFPCDARLCLPCIPRSRPVPPPCHEWLRGHSEHLELMLRLELSLLLSFSRSACSTCSSTSLPRSTTPSSRLEPYLPLPTASATAPPLPACASPALLFHAVVRGPVTLLALGPATDIILVYSVGTTLLFAPSAGTSASGAADPTPANIFTTLGAGPSPMHPTSSLRMTSSHCSRELT